ncbi:MAG: sulfotransferase family 2 domain-containing protein [Acidobacteria bacterium]|nr:sulfotransferase family 2 domain-containing protein [Acidobacteriota bacterium]
MVITPDFVFIHLTKTGGTYVEAMLARLYGDRSIDVDQHGTCSDVPAEHRGKPLLSTVRNPYDRYVSQYRYGWWKISPDEYCGTAAMREMFPHWPDISFAEFLELANTKFMNCHRCAPNGFVNENFPPERRLGWHTEGFVRFYFHNPRQVYARLDEDAIASGSFKRDMYDVHFLRTGNLRRELHDYLLALGHPAADLAFILSSERVLPEDGLRRPDNDPWQSHYTPALKQLVRDRERLIFRCFPEFDDC